VLLNTLWAWAKNLLALVGGATLLSLAWFWGTLWYETHVSPPVYQAMPPVSAVAEKLAASISPAIVRFAAGAEDDFARYAPAGIPRWVFHRGYPYAVKAIPEGAKVGCNLALDRFGSMTAAQVAAMLVEHQRSRGREAHPSVRELADGPFEERTILFP
jgi:hypothetical protein